MAENIQGLCKDLNKLCDRRDEIYKEMEAMRIKVDEFKRFDTFYYEIVDESEKQPVLKKGGKHKKNKKPMGFMQSCCDLIIYFIYSL